MNSFLFSYPDDSFSSGDYGYWEQASIDTLLGFDDFFVAKVEEDYYKIFVGNSLRISKFEKIEEIEAKRHFEEKFWKNPIKYNIQSSNIESISEYDPDEVAA